MKPSTTAILILSLVGAAIGIFAPSAEAAPPVGGCNDVTTDCTGLVCVWISQQVPQCVRDPCKIAHCVTLQRLYCIEGQPNCPAGELVCALPDSVSVCVSDPCYTTACFVPPCACAPYNADPSFGPLVGVCVAGVTSQTCYGFHDACVQFSQEVPFCVDVPDVIYSPRACLQGVRDCASGDWACVGSICMMQPCQYCVPLQADPVCLVAAEENTQLAGVSYHDCYHVDGYVCVDPVWYGGHGIWGWVCEESTPFSLP
jgi:hypothetical protein